MYARILTGRSYVLVSGAILVPLIGTVSAFGYDFSAPERSLASLQDAFRQRDAAGIADGSYFSGWDPMSESAKQERVAQWLHSDSQAHKEQFESTRMLLLQLSVRQVDSTVPYSIQQKTRGSDAPFTEAVRVMCTFQPTPELPFPPELDHVVAVYFVHRARGWQWYCHPYLSWNSWSYDCSTPEKAWHSVLRAVGDRDVTGVYNMIDLELLAGIDRATFVSTTRERLEQIDQCKAAYEAACEKAREARERAPKRPSPPFLERDPHASGSAKLEVQQSVQDGAQTARIWHLKPSGERAAFETFVKRDGQWRWRPKSEYTVWQNLPPATRPASAPAP